MGPYSLRVLELEWLKANVVTEGPWDVAGFSSVAHQRQSYNPPKLKKHWSSSLDQVGILSKPEIEAEALSGGDAGKMCQLQRHMFFLFVGGFRFCSSGFGVLFKGVLRGMCIFLKVCVAGLVSRWVGQV